MIIILHAQSTAYHAAVTIAVNFATATCTGSVQLIKLMDPYWGMAHIIAAFNAIVTQRAMMGMKARHLGLERERAAQLSMKSQTVIVTPKPRLPALERERPAQL